MKNKKHIPPAHLDILTPLYDFGCSLIGLGERFRREMVGQMDIKGDERVLDAGCGTGAFLMVLKGLYPDVEAEGIDPDEPALDITRRKSSGKELEIRWTTGSMEEMPYENDFFDLVISTLAFHHLDAVEKLKSVKECLRILKPGGRFLLADIAPDESGLSGSLLFKALSFFEPICPAEHLINIMKEAGFSGVRVQGQLRYRITCIEGRKG